MQDVLLPVLEQYGIPTAMLVLMVFLFIKFTDAHRKERQEWREDMKGTNDKYYSTQKENNDVLRGLTSAIERFHG